MPPMNWFSPQRNNMVHDVWNPRNLGPTIRLFIEREDVAEFRGIAVSADRLGVLPHIPSVVPRRGAPVLGESPLSTLDVRGRVSLVVTFVRLASTSAAPRIKPIARSATNRELGEREATVARGAGLHTQKLSTSDSLKQLSDTPRHTPSPKELTREDGFGFGSPPPEKESLPALAPELLRKINEVLRASRFARRTKSDALRASCPMFMKGSNVSTLQRGGRHGRLLRILLPRAADL